LIETYVGKMGLPLPLAVRKMSALAAEALKLPDRGLIKEGYKADLVLFDPRRVHETTTWVKPEQLATGFDIVIVNGRIAREAGQMAPGRFGRALTAQQK
jgi:N-acyl-D-aspartate/D-glutamate deacylase